MTRTEYAWQAISRELDRRRTEIDDLVNLRSITLVALFDKRGTVYAVEFSQNERRVLDGH